jgi:hypothetical protein
MSSNSCTTSSSESNSNNSSNQPSPDKKPYDILPGKGEIVLWAAKDKRGYFIDMNGSWLEFVTFFINT